MKLCRKALTTFFWSALPLFAAPSGFVSKSGDATFDAEQMVIRSKDQAIVHWDAFSIASHETVRFDSPAVLNRVVGTSVSEIHGCIQSNGAVWLINPNGITIGPQGRINAANFLASTLDLLDNDFLEKNAFTFFGKRGAIEQSGVIECPNGYVMLMSAEKVVQDGRITAEKVGIGVGREILFSPKSSPLMAVRLETVEEGLTSNCFTKAIQHKGLIEAKSFEERGGEVYLVADGLNEVSGEIVAKGGTVHVLGEHVVLVEKASIDVSGKTGGGTVLVGGDYQGKNPEILNARHTLMTKDVCIYADALETGNGGKVILWADEGTYSYGTISARGGELSGDGGFVEVSGKYLDFQSFVDRRAPNGKMGMLLLDPINITISSAAESGNVINPGGAGTYTFSGCSPSPAIINSTTLGTNLAAGSVTINTSATGATGCTDAGTITISSAISWSGDGTLTLIADRWILVNSSITHTGGTGGANVAMNFTALGHGSAVFDGMEIFTAVSSVNNKIILSAIGGDQGGIGVQVGGAASVTSTNNDVTFENCYGGGQVSGNNSHGVLIQGAVTAGGTLTFNGIYGGGTDTSTTNIGLDLDGAAAGLFAPTITINNVFGGNGSTANYGFLFNTSATLGNSSTNSITLTAQAGGETSNNFGIWLLSGTIETAASGTVTLNGTGGGVAEQAGASNYGVRMGPITYTNIGTLAVTGKGGKGSGGSHRGVWVQNAIDLGTVNNATIRFENSNGGTGGSSCYGVIVGAAVTAGATGGATGGSIVFNNIHGGGDGTGSSQYGLYISSGDLSAQTITASDIFGGNGTASSRGCQLDGSAVVGNTTNTSSISITATGTGVGGTNYGLVTAPGIIRTASGGTIVLNGTSTQFGTGSGNVGARFQSSSTIGTGADSIQITGIAGNGTNGNYGTLIIDSTVGDASETSTIEVNGTGGVGTDSNFGVYFNNSTVQTNSGTLTATGVGGDGSSASNIGIFLATAGVVGSNTNEIYLTGTGGAGTATNYGINPSTGTPQIGDSATTTRIELKGTGGIGGSTNRGINLATASFQTAAGGVLVLEGIGGGTPNSASSGSNYGVTTSGTVTFSSNLAEVIIKGKGGVGDLGDNRGAQIGVGITLGGATALKFQDVKGGDGPDNSRGVVITSALSTLGSIEFTNIQGGGDGTGTGNYGVHITTGAQLNAPTISGTDITGGSGTTSSIGLDMDGTAVIGNASAPYSTSSISFTATGGTEGSSNHGIINNGATINTAASGSVTLIGTGRGTTGGGGSNFGIYLATGSYSNNIGSFTLQGVGGVGGSGYGVRAATTLAFTGSTDITFKNCVGGAEGGGRGVSCEQSITTLGNIVFQNIRGGDDLASNYGVSISSGITVAGANVTASDIHGGGTTSANYGFYVLGTVGDSNTTSIDITAVGGGSTSSYGILLEAGSIATAAAGTATLHGTGGGDSGGSGNYGIRVVTAGGTYSTNMDTFTLTGIGGAGSNSYGIHITAPIDLSGGGSTDIVFKDCLGGTGSAGLGVSIVDEVSTLGNITFNNISGNGTGADNWGLRIEALLTGATITGTNISGGANGTNTNYGFYLAGGTLGSAADPATSSINISATAGGTGTDNIGIILFNSASVITTTSGTVVFNGVGSPSSTVGGNSGISVRDVTFGSGVSSLSLIGTGGGTSGGSGANNYGIVFETAAPTFTTLTMATFTLQGVGGAGSGGGHIGVSVGQALNLGATGTDFVFQNCTGGLGSAGVQVNASITATGGGSSCTFTNCTGGNSSTANYGVALTAETVNVVTISGSNIHGGAGTDSNIGFNLTGGSLGGANTTTITMSANSLGTGASNHGISLGAGTVQASGMVSLTGSGSTAATGDGSTGIVVSGVTLDDVQTLNLTGTGGSGGAQTRGIDIGASTFMTSPTAINLTGHGGSGSSATDGVRITSGFSASNAALTFLNCTGGSSGLGASITSTVATSMIAFTNVHGAGHGVEVSGALNATTILGTGIQGGTGAGSSGFVTTGGSVGDGTTTTINLTASSNGSGDSNNGFSLGSGTFLASSSITLTGTGSLLASGTNNVGVLGNSASAVLNAPTITLTGTGGTGTTGNSGISWVNGNIGPAAGSLTTAVTLSGTAGGTGGSNLGVSLAGGAINLHDTDPSTLTVTGFGGGVLGGAGAGNYGVALTNTSYTGASPIYSFTGTGGRGTNTQYGVVIDTNPLTLANSTTFTGTGGFGGATNAGVVFAQDFTLSAGTLTLTNCTGGSGSTDNYGVWVDGTTLTVTALTASNIDGGSGSGSDHGFFVGGGTINCSGDLSIAAASSGSSGSNSSGIRIDSSGSIAVTGGTLSLTGTGTAQSVTNSHGIHLTAASLSADDDITLTGTAGTGSGSSGIAVDSGAAITATSTAAITFNGQSGGSNNDFQLGLSTITSASGAITWNDPVVLTANPTITSTSGNVTFNETVDGTFNLTVTETTGTVRFVEVVGGTTPLTDLTIEDAVSSLRIDDNVSLSGANDLTIAAATATTIGGTSTIETNGANMTWSGTINEAPSTVANLTLSSGAGTITLGANIGNTTALNSFTASGAVALDASIGVSATDITFSNTINGAQSLTLTGNTVTLSGIVGGSTRLTNFTIANTGTAFINANVFLTGAFLAGTGLVDLNANIATESNTITFTGPVDVTGARNVDSSLAPASNADDVLFDEPINGPGSLSVIGNTVTFVSTAGASTPFDSIDVQGSSIVIGGNQVATSGITYTGPVTTNTTVTMTNTGVGGISFSSTIGTGGNPLTLSAPSSAISVTGIVDTNGGDFTAHTGGNATFSALIDTTNGGDVDIESTGGSILTTGINSSSAAGVGGSIFLQPSSGLTSTALGNIPDGTITLAGDLTATGSLSTNGGVISLAPDPRADYPSIATIFSPEATSITLRGNSLTVGPQEVVTILGNFIVRLETIGSLVDLVVQGNLDIESPSFISHRRDPIDILASDGVLYSSPTSHIVYKTVIALAVDNLTTSAIDQVSTLVASDLQYTPNSYTLNFDPGATPIPPAPPPLPITVRENDIETMWINLSEMGDRLPLYRVRKVSMPICRKEKKRCFYEERAFESLLPENKVE